MVLPAAHSETVLRGCHDEVGYLGLMWDGFFWPQMAIQVKEHFEKCQQCIACKAKQQMVPMGNIMATHPPELVHIDNLCLEPGRVRKKVCW